MWRYVGARDATYGAWHLTADGEGCARLLAAIDALAAGAAQTAPLPVAIATAEVLSVLGRDHPAQAVRTLQLARVEQPNAFAIVEHGGALAITVGAARIAELRQLIVDVGQGHGDVSMGADGKRSPPDQRLWLWWMPGGYRGEPPRR